MHFAYVAVLRVEENKSIYYKKSYQHDFRLSLWCK